MNIGRHHAISAMVLVVFIATAVYAYPRLPQRVASHFGIDGRADGWMSKDTFILTMCGSMVLLTLIAWSAGWVTKMLPARWINLPNKQYWLADDRREQTLAFLSRYSVWVLLPSQILVLIVFQMTINMAIKGGDKLPSAFFVILVLCIVTTLFLAFYPLFRFRRGVPHG